MRVARLVACVLVVSMSFAVPGKLWAQLVLDEFLLNKYEYSYDGPASTRLGEIAGLGLAPTSLSSHAKESTLRPPSELARSGSPPLRARRGTKTEIDEAFTLQLDSRQTNWSSELVSIAAQQPHTNALEVANSEAVTWTSSPVQLSGTNQQFVSLGDDGESMELLHLPVSVDDVLRKDERGPTWLPSTELR